MQVSLIDQSPAQTHAGLQLGFGLSDCVGIARASLTAIQNVNDTGPSNVWLLNLETALFIFPFPNAFDPVCLIVDISVNPEAVPFHGWGILLGLAWLWQLAHFDWNCFGLSFCFCHLCRLWRNIDLCRCSLRSHIRFLWRNLALCRLWALRAPVVSCMMLPMRSVHMRVFVGAYIYIDTSIYRERERERVCMYV